MLPWSLGECDSLRLTVLVDNFVDMLMTDQPGLTRVGMPEHFAPRHGTPLAENGIGFLLELCHGRRTTTVLFDVGLSSSVLVHNARVLGVDLTRVDQVVLSHGHPDHVGGVYAALDAIGRPVPVLVHPHAFRPRMITRPDAVIPYFNRDLDAATLQQAGARLVPARGPVPLAPGVCTSGEIETTVEIEQEVPRGRMSLCDDGHLAADPIDDYLTVVVNLRDVGLVVLDPCGHAGVLSSLRHATALTGVDRVHAVLGGFHLGHPGISQERIDRTADGLAHHAPALVAPMHCSGFRAQRAVSQRLPDAFVQMTVGAVLDLGAQR